jgi:carbon-monoxide dehydrogenase large subunit
MSATAGTRRYVGERVQRVEDARLLTGRGSFVDDVELPGMMHVAFVRSPHAHARIVKVEVAEAESLLGFPGVFTGADLTETLVTGPSPAGLRAVVRPLLARERVRFVGEAIVAVVGRSRYEAEDAVDAIGIDWEPLERAIDTDGALAPDAAVLHPDVGDNVAAESTFASAGLADVFARAEHIFVKRLHTGRASAMPMECRGVVADPAANGLTVWSSTQLPHGLRGLIARMTELTESEVRVIAADVGGGFGGKGHFANEEVVVPLLARRLRCPLKWIEDRYEHMAANAHAKEMVIEIEIAVGPAGRFLGFRGRFLGDCGAYSVAPYGGLVDAITAATLLPSVYSVPEAGYRAVAVMTNKCPAGAYRAVGRSSGQAAQELLIDDIARNLGLDPLELRLRNVIPHTGPCISATDMHYDGGSFRESLERAAELVDYAGLRERQVRLREEGRYLGVGLCPYVEPTGQGTAMSKANGVPSRFFDEAVVTVEQDGSAVVRVGQQNHGQGHETVFSQIAADSLGLPLELVKVVQGDTASAAQGMGTFASRGAVVGGGTVRLAAEAVREKMLTLGARMLEVDPADLEITDGRVTVRGIPGSGLSVAELAQHAYFSGDDLPAGVDAGLSASRSYDPAETYSNGTIAVALEVDVATGVVAIEQLVAVEDCGTVLNPMIVDGQVTGGLAQGIGLALYEEIVYAEEGQLLTSTLMDYPIPSAAEVPAPLVSHIVTPSPVTVGGVKGAGEAGTQSAPAAIAMAVADALEPFGIDIDRIPLTPDRIRRLLRDARIVA